MRAPAAALAILVSLATADLLPDSDGLCQRTTDTLCVKDAFLTIAIIARSVNRTATEIDRHIVSKYKEIYTLAWSLNYEMGIVQRHLPPPAQHVKFAQRSNVDRVGSLAHGSLSIVWRCRSTSPTCCSRRTTPCSTTTNRSSPS